MRKYMVSVAVCMIAFIAASCTERPKGVYESRIGDTYTFVGDSLIVQAAVSGCGLGEYHIDYSAGGTVMTGIEENDLAVRKTVSFERQPGGCWIMYEEEYRIVLHPVHGN